MVTIQAVPVQKAAPLSNLHSTSSSIRLRDVDLAEVRHAETTGVLHALPNANTECQVV